MSSADLQTTVIACPNCGTRYQVPRSTLGAAGREVQCAQCGKPWHAVADAPPPPAVEEDRLFTPADEQALDEAFEMEAEAVAPPSIRGADAGQSDEDRSLAEIRAAIAPKPKKPAGPSAEPANLKRVRKSFAARQARTLRRLPLARLRRTVRLVAFASLAIVLVAGIMLRTDIVRIFPSLAGLYAAIGMPVNVVGLEFENAKTLTTFRDGKKVMTISARIRSVAGQIVHVPPVQVSLLGEDGTAIYEWTTTPQAREMAPGDLFDFSTEVNSPPEGAAKVRLSFSNRAGGTAAPATAKAH